MTSSRVSVVVTGAVLLLVAAANLYGLRRGLPCRYSYYQDAVAPQRALGFLETYFDPPDFTDKYAPAAYLYFAIPARVALWLRGDEQAAALLSIARERGPEAWQQIDASLWVDYLPYEDALSDMIVAGRLASALASVMLAAFAALLAGRLFGPRAMPFAAILLGLHPYVVFYGHTTNVDVPYLAFTLAALYFLARTLTGGGWWSPILAGVSAAIAAGVKDQVVAYLVLLPLVALLLDRRAVRRGEPARLTVPRCLAACAAFVVVYAFAGNWIFDPDGWMRHARYGLSPEIKEQYDMVKDVPTLRGWVLLLLYVVTYFVRSAGPAGCLLMVLGLWEGWRRHRSAFLLLVLPSLCYLLLFVFRMHLVYGRHLLPFLVPAMILAAGAVARRFEPSTSRRSTAARFAAAVVAVLVVAVAWRGVTVNRLWADDPRQRAAAWMEEHLPPGTAVVAESNHATPPPRIPSSSPQRWASGRDLIAALRELEPPVFMVVKSTYLKPVIIPQHPDVDGIVESAGLPLVASFPREVDHPILDDIDAAPVVILFARR